ncbi:50S ribosomal protein L13 [Patescibacteria group bacterium]
MKKTQVTRQKDIKRDWYLVDVQDRILGRVATEIAALLMGKKKTYFTPSLDCGDYVVVTNAAKVAVTGKKRTQKMYYRHSNYPGGFKETPFDVQMEKDPTKIIYHAVAGMLPKNKLRAKRLFRLKIFADGNHHYADKLTGLKKKEQKNGH